MSAAVLWFALSTGCDYPECDLPECDISRDGVQLTLRTTGEQTDSFSMNWWTDSADGDSLPTDQQCDAGRCGLTFLISHAELHYLTPVQLELELMRNGELSATGRIDDLVWTVEDCVSCGSGSSPVCTLESSVSSQADVDLQVIP